MSDHYLTPIYKPCSWSVDPVEPDEATPEAIAREKEIAEQLADVLRGSVDARCTASVAGPRRPSLAEIMGEDYTEGMTADELLFIAQMLKP